MIKRIQLLEQMQQNPKRALRFDEPELEEAFSSWLKAEHKSIAIAVLVLICTTWIAFFAADIARLHNHTGVYAGGSLFHTVISIRLSLLAFLLCSVLAAFKFSTTKLPLLVLFTYTLMSMCAAILSNIYEAHTEYKSGWIPVVLVVPLFVLPIGVLFRQSLPVGLGIVGFLVGSYVLMIDLSSTNQFSLYFFSLAISLVSGIAGGYYREKIMRSAFVAIQLLELRSFVDPLTNLGNRRYFNEFANRLFDDARRNQAPMSLTILDIDYFKKINDGFGHDFGDKVLIFFSQEIQKIVRRPLDLPIRLGGEEFAIIFPNMTAREAEKRVELMQTNLKQASGNIDGVSIQKLGLSFSAGLCDSNKFENFKHLYKKADELLYLGKHEGRDRIIYED